MGYINWCKDGYNTKDEYIQEWCVRKGKIETIKFVKPFNTTPLIYTSISTINGLPKNTWDHRGLFINSPNLITNITTTSFDVDWTKATFREEGYWKSYQIAWIAIPTIVGKYV